MNKIAKRLVAGASAVALLASAVGVDQLADLFMKTSYADSTSTSTRKGQSTGFSNLEQDTTAKNEAYNTGYGLYTNKTATALKDGRTFDVNLESWYVGENPVDVATILDASGSMAWTVDTLDPLVVNTDEKAYEGVKDKYGTIDELADLQRIQDENGGYLPQDVVDCILKTTETDNSKLSYAGYKYYVYEARSSVSEFVPLGYWDGGEPTGMPEPIGYYPFDGSLKNEVNGKDAKYIKHPTEGGAYDAASVATQEAAVTYTGSNGIDISKTAPVGALKLDLKENTDESGKLVITTKIGSNETTTDGIVKLYDNTVILYITDGTNYIKIYRGNKTISSTDPSKPSNSTNRLRIVTNDTPNGKYLLNANSVFNGKGTEANQFTFTFDFDNKTLNVKTTTAVNLDSTGGTEKDYTTSTDESAYFPEDFDLTNLQIYVGGATETISNYSEVFVGSVNVQVGENEIADYDFTSESLKNTANDGAEAILVEQAYSNSGSFGAEKLDGTEAKPVYAEGGLDLNKTAKNGAIMLDVVPQIEGDKDGFTISLQIRKSGSGLTKKDNNQRNIFYLGNKNTSKNEYYQFFRSAQAAGYLALVKGKQNDFTSSSPTSAEKEGYTYYRGGLNNGDTWYTNTLVFEPVDGGKYKITPYIDGKSYKSSSGTFQSTEPNTPEMESITVDSEDLVFLLGALQNGSEEDRTHFIKNLYIFNEALTEAQVEQAYKATSGTTTSTAEEDCGKYHATTEIGGEDVDIAQISDRLINNPYDSQRRGWYYVNSHSTWEDIEGCLKSGKQFIGIYTDDGMSVNPNMAKDNVTIPYGMELKLSESIKNYDNDPSTPKHADYEAPSTERSIRFYVDGQNHLRCFVWSGSDTKSKGDERTFCSLVYEKDKDNQKTKYEALNGALNDFYKNLATYSDLSNTALVRFSTHNLMEEPDNVETRLKSLIMKDWTNYSDVYTDDKTARDKYLQDLLIPGDGETSVPTDPDSTEFPYVMTGGTYTWTGLKSFYDNMVDTTGKGSSDPAYDIANDARDKYLIIFTDGRDNTQDFPVVDGKNQYDQGSNYKKTDYVGKYSPYTTAEKHKVGSNDEHEIKYDGDLAEAWADKLKDEGYTIYCVMMATGSISQTANESEYNRAYNFMKTLAGANEGDERDLTTTTDPKAPDKYIRIVDNNSDALINAFKEILEQIQQPRNDYTVQDYIDPRFDLVDKNDNIYHLGAGGKITVTDKDGNAVTGLTLSDKTITTGNEFTVGTVIDPKEGQSTTGLAYTPRNSEMVNRKATSSGYDNGDSVGTGYIYYDDVKDMYYLRWTDQIIPMENEAFDTDEGKPIKYLDVWSATIRLKAKDDFIGGNNILTNGNEAGENLVYSDATIENMDKGDNYKLYGFKDTDLVDGKVPYREKLKALSGTNRKINAVDAGGVSQAVYGNGIDIPSSGFPRTTVNVRLLKLDANDLNDVIYMGEVVSPTMMLADLENGYMTGSYYLQYLERYAYRVYGEDAGEMPLIELLNKWLKINDTNYAEKTFTIPYIYLPDPEYDDDGKLKKSGGKVVIQNSTGATMKEDGNIDFTDLNLRDVTGFITYTWKRDDGGEEQQKTGNNDSEGNPIYDITKDYVVKNTNQIKYNLQLKFTPLKETADGLDGFTLDTNFINADTSTGKGGDKFFNIGVDGEFNDTSVTAWTTDYGRADYLQAMISEKHTYEPHVMYDKDAAGGGKWVLVDEDDTDHTPEKAVAAYKEADTSGQTTVGTDNKTVTDSGVYDWDNAYKPDEGAVQIESGKPDNYYTNTPDNVGVSTDGFSLEANTTYTKDVVNAALALELVVDGKYLNPGSEINPNNGTKKTFTFEATRNYNDPLDPLPYGGDVYADVHTDPSNSNAWSREYRLTFTVDADSIPKDPQENQLYTVWAKLTNVEVEECETGGVRTGNYTLITNSATTDNPYLGYEKPDALPIGTYSINVYDNPLSDPQFKIADAATAGQSDDLHFKYLNADSDTTSYKHDRFPDHVVEVSADAAKDTKDGEYQIWNTSKDNSSKNIAECKSTGVIEEQKEIEFYFGTVEVDRFFYENKGESVKDNPETANDYAKDRLGIIMLSVDPNSLTITKEVTNTNTSTATYKNNDWNFTVTIKTSDWRWLGEKDLLPKGGPFDYTLYTKNGSGNWGTGTVQQVAVDQPSVERVDDNNIYTLTIHLTLKHDQKAVFRDLPSGTWQVTEDLGGVFCTPHNNASGFGEDEWRYQNSAATNVNTLNPISQVDYINEFPYELPSAGGSGTVRYILLGTLLTAVGAMLFAVLYFDRRKKARK